MKKGFSILVLVTMIASLLLCGYKYSKPEVKISIILSNITNEEYKKLGENNKPKGITIYDLKKLSVLVKIVNSKRAVQRSIDIPDLFTAINKFDGKVRGIAGGGGSQNNIGKEATAEASSYMLFDSRGISNKDITRLYADSQITISYKLKNSPPYKAKFSIGKNITIKN